MRQAEVIRQLMAHHHVSRGTAYRDVGEAKLLQAEEYARVETDQHKAQQVDRLWRIADSAERAGRFRDAVAAIREVVRITGTAAPDQVNHTHGGIISMLHAAKMAELTEEELRAFSKFDRPVLEAGVPAGETEH